ncbi:MAG: hypothetical protein JWN27_3983 [Candidatus Eremiobacteraeota bacterium]|jgi:hypothetical protein|nr:hypothetical protein [Candidatus Eremiobacteraeota bacterium]
MNGDGAEPGMIRERTTLPDGRYLIFYTFEDEAADDAGADGTDV